MKIKDTVAIVNGLEKVDNIITDIMNKRGIDELVSAKDELRIVIEKIKDIEL